MMSTVLYRRPVRGRPRLGFQFQRPNEVQLREGEVVCCSESQQGKTIGELEVGVFAASLVIDRDGALAVKACTELQREVPADVTALAVELPGASGFRAEMVARAPLPYVAVLALVPAGGIEGGVLIKVRSARPDWPAADQILGSLRILTRDGIAPGGDDQAILPMIERG
jgi:hypothetical protein